MKHYHRQYHILPATYKWLFQLDDAKSLHQKNRCFTKQPLHMVV